MHIHKLQHIHEVSKVEINDFTQPTKLFSHTNEVDPTELAEDEITPSEKHQYNGASPPHGTRPLLPHSPLIYASVMPESPELLLHVDAGYAACLVSTDKHPEVLHKVAEYRVFGVHQD